MLGRLCALAWHQKCGTGHPQYNASANHCLVKATPHCQDTQRYYRTFLDLDDDIPERVDPDPRAGEGLRAQAPPERVWEVAAVPVPSRLEVDPSQWNLLPSWLRPALEREISMFGESLGKCDASIAAARAAEDSRSEEKFLSKRGLIMAASEKILVYDPASNKECHGRAKRSRLLGRANYQGTSSTLILRLNCDELRRALMGGRWLGRCSWEWGRFDLGRVGVVGGEDGDGSGRCLARQKVKVCFGCGGAAFTNRVTSLAWASWPCKSRL